MIVMTGPQSSDEDLGDLREAAGVAGALLVADHPVLWASVTALYRLPRWHTCSLALADVALADALAIPCVDLTL